MDVYTLLIIGHLIGTVLGVGGATMIEVHLNKALADGKMEPDERNLLGANFTTLRIGLVIALFTGVGFIALYIAAGQETRLQNPVFWAKMFMIVIVTINALLLQAHKISLYWGSALSFITWWAAALLGMFLTNSVRFGFFEIMITYALSIVAGAFILHRIREHMKKRFAAKQAKNTP